MRPGAKPVRRRFGVRLLGALSARSGGHVVFGAGELMAARTEQIRRLARLPGAYTVRTAERADEPMLGRLTGSPAKTARLLSGGDVGLLAMADGQVQAMEWARFGPAEYDWDREELGVTFRVPDRWCWLHNGNGSGDGNGPKGPWAMILGWLPRLLLERGIETVCLQVASDNPYSIQCHESLGFRRVGGVRAVRVGALKLVSLRLGTRRWIRLQDSQLDLSGVRP
jgi:hypothetical protein